jgi:hypothetical protein
MMPSERVALAGLLSALRPTVSIEIGIAAGGSLDPISAWSDAVHAFDFVRHDDVTSERFPNVTFHIGDSHELLPPLLKQLAAAGKPVDFVLVDGDHTAEGVRRDLEDLLSSPSLDRSVIVLHDTLNERVRAGLESVDYSRYDKVNFIDLDFLPGRVFREPPWQNRSWLWTRTRGDGDTDRRRVLARDVLDGGPL